MCACPQKENGYTAISNEIYDALIGIRISGEARQCLDLIFRKTYGYNKKEDAISLSQFQKFTGLKKNTICRAINKLEEMNLITKKENDTANIYGILKDYTLWKPLPKKRTLPKKRMTVPKKENRSLPKKRHTIDNYTKDNITKDTSEQSSAINKIFEVFYKVNQTINFGHKGNRSAVIELLKKYSLEDLIKFSDYAVFVQGKPYAPVITTPYQLKEKLTQLKIYYERQKTGGAVIIE